MRTTAIVPRALYMTFIVNRDYPSRLAPTVFTPMMLDLEGFTLFTILLFRLERARPSWLPAAMGVLAPSIMHSNWRFYGRLRTSTSKRHSGVLFVRSVTTSLLMSIFGRRIARCFPLHRAEAMTLDVTGDKVSASIRRGNGSAPEMEFEGERDASVAERLPNAGLPFPFADYYEYARWLIDQHLSLAIWPDERIVQDMHLDFSGSTITPLRYDRVHIDDPGLGEIFDADARAVDCFLVDGLRVFLDSVTAERSPVP